MARLAIFGLCGVGVAIATPVLFNSSRESPTAETRSGAADGPQVFTLDHPPILVTPQTTVLMFDVPVVNRTGTAVRFGPPACGCACSETTLPRQELAPGEGMTVRLTVRPSLRTGPQHFSCNFGDDAGRAWAIGAKVELIRPEQFDPDRLTFGRLDPDRPATGTARFLQHANREADLPPPPVFRPTDPAVTLTAGPPVVVRSRPGLVTRETPLTVTAVPPSRAGYAEVQVHPVPAGDAILRVEWKVRPGVTPSPRRVVFLDAAAARERVQFTADDGEPFRVTAATATAPGVDVVVADDGRAVEVSAARVTGTATGDIVVKTTHPRAHVVRVPFAVLGLKGGRG